MKKGIVLILLTLTLIASLTSCKCEEKEEMALCIIWGNHASSQIPDLSMVKDEIRNATLSGADFSLVVCDGNPYVTGTFTVNSSAIEGSAKVQKERIIEDVILNIQENLPTASAPEVDSLEAIEVGAAELALSSAPIKNMVIFDTLLQTCGYLNFAENPELLYSSPKEICDKLEEFHAIPDLNGVNVTWVKPGFAMPQEALNNEEAQNHEDIWKEISKRANVASFNVLERKAETNIDSSLPNVSVVEVQGSHSIKPLILTEEEISFKPDEAKFIDSKSAEKTIQPAIEFLLHKKENKLLIIGTTASGEEMSCIRLSQSRAESVAKLIQTTAGIEPYRLVCLGLGFNNPWHQEDKPGGIWNEEVAKTNRKVVMMDAASKEGQALLKQYL